MKSTLIRQKFVDYFKKHGHQSVMSSSLIPENDPTLLFANAGMNQFKNTFLGLEKRDYNRAVSVQKCVRAGGKHNDLENVGFTARHHTFFEMLGNFSFGDYFKKDAIHFAWEFLTKELQIPKEKLYVTVFETDDEAADIWHHQEGVPRERIFRFGEKDNFWRMGDTGPCGPCSEIFYDHGPKAGKESDPYKGIAAGEDRFVEIWNLVFMQFFEKAPGLMEPLPKPSVDTGSGFERLVAAMQGKFANYDTDLFQPMIQKACQLAGCQYIDDPDKLKDPKVFEITSALRVLADHCRSTAFLIADGALPSNEGRGYVLRRILRRGIRYGRKLSSTHSLLPAMIEALIPSMKDAYPELEARREMILTTVREEETRFLSTLDQGTHLLQESLNRLKTQNQKLVPGDIVFKLYDTYGFPADLTRLMSEEQGFTVDEEQFEKEMQLAKDKAKSSWKGRGISSNEALIIQMSQKIFEKHGATKFLGYEQLESEAQVLGLSDGQQESTALSAGSEGLLFLNQSCFYAEGGGQIGDQGTFTNTNKDVEVRVLNTTKHHEVFAHHIQVVRGTLNTTDRLIGSVTAVERRQIAANHSATHLLHAALRKVLGTHVTQAGSLVDGQKLRFDFTHSKSLDSAEISKIESLVNEQIAEAHPVQCQVMDHKKALEAGAMALFGEKYGDQVRVVRMDQFSTELCGGTHVQNTSHIRIFKIVSESGVSAGVRRIEALTADMALQYFQKNTSENQKARFQAGMNESWTQYFEATKEVASWIDDKKSEIRQLEKEIKRLQGAQVNADSLATQAATLSVIGNPQVHVLMCEVDVEDREVLAQLNDQLKDKWEKSIVVLLGKGQGSYPMVVSVSKALNPKVSAGMVLKEVAGHFGGKGGGRPDFAQGAVPSNSNFDQGIKKLYQYLTGLQ